jgi:phage baseplate assembly protein W
MTATSDIFKFRTLSIIAPVKDSNLGSIFAMSTTSLEKYKSNIHIALLTGFGQRVMIPSFGSAITQTLFEQVSEDTYSSLEATIKNAISRWIPEISIDNISFSRSDIENNKIAISLTFSLKANRLQYDNIMLEVG